MGSFKESLKQNKVQSVPKFFSSELSLVSKELLEKTGADPERSLDFVLSDKSVDRDNDTINQDGWSLDRYRKNPVVLWAHDSSQPPVAKSLHTWVSDGKLRSINQFATRDEYPFADTVHRLYKGGFLRAVSVGFMPIEYKFNAERGDMAIDFVKQELMEHSCVPVPSNANALQGAKSSGIDLGPIVEWAEQFLDGAIGKGLWLPRDTVEKMWKASKEDKVISTPKQEEKETITVTDELLRNIGDMASNAIRRELTAITGRFF